MYNTQIPRSALNSDLKLKLKAKYKKLSMLITECMKIHCLYTNVDKTKITVNYRTIMLMAREQKNNCFKQKKSFEQYSKQGLHDFILY